MGAGVRSEGVDPAVRVDGLPGTPPGRLLRRVIIGIGVVCLSLTVLLGGGLWYLTDRYAGNVDRVADVFEPIPGQSRPAPPTPGQPAGAAPVTFLLVGSDSRAQVARGELPGARSDAIMVARISADRRNAQVISIPRDSWVRIPGHGMGKINAAYAYGGPSLLVRTVEQLTQVRIDHYAAIDLAGLIQVTDDLGGVDVVVAETTKNGPYTFEAGVNRLDGAKARWYLAQRYGLSDGDFDRVRRQQQYVQAVFEKLVRSETFTDPDRLDAALLAVTNAVAIDDALTDAGLLALAYSLRDLQPDAVDFFTAPVLGTGMEGAASVVYLDRVSCDRMWAYLNSDSLSQNAGEFDRQALPAVPR